MLYNGLNQIIQNISDNDDIVILIHDKPDGDAVGSATALALFISKLGKAARVVSPSPIPERLEFMKNDGVTYAVGKNGLGDYKYVVSVDVASPELLGEIYTSVGKIGTVIDHHKINTIDGDYKYVDPNASAAGEIVFSLISMYAMVMGSEVFDESICSALYGAISSDTGCFKYGNTTAQTHAIASQLISSGINAEEINRLLFDTKSLTQFKTEQLGIEKLKMFCDGRLAITHIEKADLDAIGATDADTETLSQLMRMISGVQIGVLMREKAFDDGRHGYKFSVRANADTDVSLLCSAFGGGGHKKAAGCTICADAQTALAAFVAEAEKYLL